MFSRTILTLILTIISSCDSNSNHCVNQSSRCTVDKDTSPCCETLTPTVFEHFTEQSKNATRCFQFTWMGHKFNNESVYLNATCYDATKRNPRVPCVKPLVISFDGSWPDVNYIWQKYPEASCLLTDGDVCARYTFYFDGHAENSTYFCTRAVDNRGIAIKSGCYQQVNGSYSTEVCLCRSSPGERPCNNSFAPSPKCLTIVLIAIAQMHQFFVNIT